MSKDSLNNDRYQKFIVGSKEVWKVVWEAIQQFMQKDDMHMAAGIAYYAFLSLFPLAMLLLSIAGFFFEADEATSWLMERLGSQMPLSEEFLDEALRGIITERGYIGIAGFIGLIIGSIALFGAIMRSINRAWGLGGKNAGSFLKRKLWELAMLGAAVVLFLLSLTATGVVDSLVHNSGSHFILSLIPFFSMICVFALIYKLLPALQVKWRDIWLPAVVAAIGFEVAKHVFVWYVANLGNYSAMYGFLASVILLLLWVYISAIILLFGAELGHVIAVKRVYRDID
ncbi:MAG: YihY/virulence factor BrkB family protein [Chloroflexota bacterium]|nr:YihY/virulence factor BrkB family protein [Chloroflexota bacterium]